MTWSDRFDINRQTMKEYMKKRGESMERYRETFKALVWVANNDLLYCLGDTFYSLPKVQHTAHDMRSTTVWGMGQVCKNKGKLGLWSANEFYGLCLGLEKNKTISCHWSVRSVVRARDL